MVDISSDTVNEILDLLKKNSEDISDLKNQVGINCQKLDGMKKELSTIKDNTDILPGMYEMVENHGTRIEDIFERLDKK